MGDTKTIELGRRNFIKTSAGAGLYIATTGLSGVATGCTSDRPVRIGFVGLGGRGTAILKIALSIKGVEIPEVCDIVPEKGNGHSGWLNRQGRRSQKDIPDLKITKKWPN